MMLDTKIFIQHITGKFIKIKYFHFVVVIITNKETRDHYRNKILE